MFGNKKGEIKKIGSAAEQTQLPSGVADHVGWGLIAKALRRLRPMGNWLNRPWLVVTSIKYSPPRKSL